MQKERNIEELPTANWLKFLLPSGIGIVFFLTPLLIDGQITVGMAWFGDLFDDLFGPLGSVGSLTKLSSKDNLI